MNRRILPALLAMALAPAAHGGDVFATVVDTSGKPVAEAIVYLQAEPARVLPATQAATAGIDQINKEFVPGTIAIRAGTKVSFPNRDNIHHHVYSFSPAMPFELPLYEGTPANPVEFRVAGIVTLGCNIHDWMRGYIVVLDTPYFAATDVKGKVVIPSVQPGQWQVRVWHADLPAQQAQDNGLLEVSDVAASTAITVRLNPQFRIRRAPTSRRADRY